MLLIHLANDLGSFYPNHKGWFDHLESEGYYPHIVDEAEQKKIVAAMDKLYGGENKVVISEIPAWFLAEQTMKAFDDAWKAIHGDRPQPTLKEMGLDGPLS